MLEIKTGVNNIIYLSGRFDASQVKKATEVFKDISESCTVDCQELEYISSAGLGVLLMTQKRLMDSKNGIKIINLNKHIQDIFRYAGFDKIFELG